MGKGKGIILGIALAGLVVSGVFVARDELTRIENGRPPVENITTDISREKSEIILKDFLQVPEHVAWVSENILRMDTASKKYGQGNYQVNLEQLTVEKEGQIDRTKVYIGDTTVEAFEVISPLSETRDLIYIQEGSYRGIYRYNYAIKDIRKVTDAMKCDPENHPYAKMSQDKSKLLYIEEGRNRLVTYNFSNGYKRIISKQYDEDSILDFEDRFSLTSDGGYILDDDKENNQISLIGADSGKFYITDFVGMQPTFDSDNKYMAFVHSDRMIGRVDLYNMKTEYVEVEDLLVSQSVKLAGESLYYLTVNRSEDTSQLMVYNYENASKIIAYHWDNMNEMLLSQGVSFYELLGYYIIDDKNVTRFIHLASQSEKAFLELEGIGLDQAPEKKFKALSQGILFKDATSYYILNDQGYSKIYNASAEIKGVFLSEEASKMMVVQEGKEGLEIVVTEKIKNIQ